VLSASPAISAQTSNQITHPVDTVHVRALPNHHPLWATASNDAGPVPPDQMVNQITMVLARSPQQEQAFKQLLEDQQNPASPNYHRWLTPDEIGARFGLSDSDIDTITGWVQSQGLHVSWISPSRTFIGFGGAAADVNRAFQTELRYYKIDGEERFSVSTAPSIPAALQPAIKLIRGLSTPGERLTPHQLDHPDFTSTSAHYLGPKDFNTIYNVPAGMTGAGQTVGIVSYSRTNFADFDRFRKLTGATFANPVEIVPTAYGAVDPGPASTTSPGYGQDIATLEVTRVGSVAPDAKILLVPAFVGTCWIDNMVADLAYLILSSPPPAQVISVSFFGGDSYVAPLWDGLFQEAAAEGITVLVASGNVGAAGDDQAFMSPPTTPDPNRSNQFCGSGYATCVGGTEFNDTSNASAYWNPSNNAGLSSARGYIPEGAWNEPGTNAKPIVAASGGGVSAWISTPSWQVGTGVPKARTGRYTPDIAFSSSMHDGYLYCYAAGGGACTDSTSFSIFAGTEAAASSMAGVAALLNQKMGAEQGNLNPLLYKLAATSPSVFHDVTVATSGVKNCTVKTPSMCNNSLPSATGLAGGQAGYLVNAGFDEVTGLGSLNVTNFLDAAPEGAPAATPVFSPDAGTYATAQIVTISGSNFGATIYYTTDGSTPTASSKLYQTPIAVSSKMTIKAIAKAAGFSSSAVATAVYAINSAAPTAATPQFSVASGTYTHGFSVAITDATAGATIYYTTDGSTPGIRSAVYGIPIQVSTPLTIRTIAVASGYFKSAVASASYIVATGEWAWMGGSKGAIYDEIPGVYGTLGVAAAGNIPGSRDSASSWIDNNGNFWLFGGASWGGLNDLWMFNPGSKYWTWMGGSNTRGQSGVYGTRGIASAANHPGTRSDATAWKDASGNFWLFGGEAPLDSSGNHHLNDLWMFNPATKLWTWMGGSKTADQVGVYGTLGVASAKNQPGSRRGASSWIDQKGNFWLFGGEGKIEYSNRTDIGQLNDLWMYSPATKLWTWMSGSSGLASGVYGTRGVPADANLPPGRWDASSWIDNKGNLWLFGGSQSMNDLWMYTPSTHQWVWVSGVSVYSGDSAQGVYGTMGVPATTNVPPGRGQANSWTDSKGDLFLFGGFRSTTQVYEELNDLWMFNPSAQEWTWIGGSNSANPSGAYGVQGISSSVNIPSGRQGASQWVDGKGNVWLFGGQTIIEGGGEVIFLGDFNDLWKFTPKLNGIPTAATPVFSVAAGAYTKTQQVTIKDATAVAAIYYTTDGTQPTSSSNKYTGAITVSATERLEAMAVAYGYFNSAVASAAYTITPPAPTPTFSPVGGTYTSTQTMKIADTATAGLKIYYTTDGSAPTIKSTVYTSAGIKISATEMIRAMAVATGYSASAVASAKYTIH
jgi:hypothetical protein